MNLNQGRDFYLLNLFQKLILLANNFKRPYKAEIANSKAIACYYFEIYFVDIQQVKRINLYEFSKILELDSLPLFKICMPGCIKKFGLPTCFRLACAFGAEKILKFLLKENKVGFRLQDNLFSATYLAARHQQLHLLKYFFRKGAKIQILKNKYLELIPTLKNFKINKILVKHLALSDKEITEFFIKCYAMGNYKFALYLMRRYKKTQSVKSKKFN